jgi:hypothetical protein
MVGTTGRFKDNKKQSDDRLLLEIGPEMEIDSLIIPAVEENPTRHIESNNTMMNSALHRGGGF